MLKNREKKRNTLLYLLLLAVLSVASHAGTQETRAVIEVTGRITDTSSGEPIPDAMVQAVHSNVSPVLTDKEGNYRFYLVGQKDFFTLRVSKKGYKEQVSQPMVPNTLKGKAQFEAKLAPQEPVGIRMKKFVAGVSISGQIIGIKAEEVGKYKVLVYILTDKWYLHPFAENKDGRGYASIKKDGSWCIDTVNRENGPFKLAMIVVPRDHSPALAISPAENSDEAIKKRFGKQLTAIHIIPAPSGL